MRSAGHAKLLRGRFIGRVLGPSRQFGTPAAHPVDGDTAGLRRWPRQLSRAAVEPNRRPMPGVPEHQVAAHLAGGNRRGRVVRWPDRGHGRHRSACNELTPAIGRQQEATDAVCGHKAADQTPCPLKARCRSLSRTLVGSGFLLRGQPWQHELGGDGGEPRTR